MMPCSKSSSSSPLSSTSDVSLITLVLSQPWLSMSVRQESLVSRCCAVGVVVSRDELLLLQSSSDAAAAGGADVMTQQAWQQRTQLVPMIMIIITGRRMCSMQLLKLVMLVDCGVGAVFACCCFLWAATKENGRRRKLFVWNSRMDKAATRRQSSCCCCCWTCQQREASGVSTRTITRAKPMLHGSHKTPTNRKNETKNKMKEIGFTRLTADVE